MSLFITTVHQITINADHIAFLDTGEISLNATLTGGIGQLLVENNDGSGSLEELRNALVRLIARNVHGHIEITPDAGYVWIMDDNDSIYDDLTDRTATKSAAAEPGAPVISVLVSERNAVTYHVTVTDELLDAAVEDDRERTIEGVMQMLSNDPTNDALTEDAIYKQDCVGLDTVETKLLC